MKTVYVSLTNKDSISKAIKELEEYKKSLEYKNDLFIRKLTEIGVEVAQEAIARGKGDTSKDARFSIVYNHTDYVIKGQIILTSTPKYDKDGRVFYPHLAWEFGAGIHFNNGNAHPLAAEMGMGVGTFPGQKFALNDFWWYKDRLGHLHLSQGTQAAMPMYKASVEIINQIDLIAAEVFNGQ